jgi:hypothetical protein
MGEDVEMRYHEPGSSGSCIWMVDGPLAGCPVIPVNRGSETWGCTRWVRESCKGTVRESHDAGFVIERWVIGEVRKGKGTEGGEDGML